MIEQKIRLLIVDDDHDTCKILKTFFDMQTNIEICGVAHNGEEAVELIYNLNPDVVILDVVMPGKDGICVLEELRVTPPAQKPLIVITSASGQELVMRRAMALGADFFVMKPYSLDVLLNRVKMVVGIDAEEHILDSDKNLEIVVAKAVLALGVPTQLLGYQYINRALNILINKNKSCSISKNVYATIAAEYSTTTECVERAIRQALKRAYENNSEFMQKVLKFCNFKPEKGPSNGQFLTFMAAYIKLEEKF